MTENPVTYGGQKVRLTPAERIRAVRAEAGLTQTKLGELSGIPQSNISNYEKGKDNPNWATVERLEQACVDWMGHEPVTLGAVDGLLGITSRTAGKLLLADPMAPPRPVDWIVEGFAARRFVTLISGQPGAGKSSVSQTIAVGLCERHETVCGMRVLPPTVHGPGSELKNGYRVMIVDAENAVPTYEDAQPLDASLVQSRLQDFGLSKPNNWRLTIAGADGFNLEKESDLKALDAALGDLDSDGTGPDVLILDSFTSLYFGSINTDNVRFVLVELNRLVVKHNLAVIVIHHTDKTGENVRGSGLIEATVAMSFTFARVSDEKDGNPARVLSCSKMRIAIEPSPRFMFVTGGGVFNAEGFEQYVQEHPEEYSDNDNEAAE